jgi:hypothetical protein
MHTVEILDEALRVAGQFGYRVRQEWLGGNGGGGCEIRGRKWLFLDLAQGPEEQLEQVLAALRRESGVGQAAIPMALRDRLKGR